MAPPVAPPVTPPVAPPVTFGPLDAAYVLATARALGVDPAVFFQSRVVQGSLRFGPDAGSTLAAFEAKLREIGQFNIGSYNNESFADIFLNARNSSEILAIFRSITAERFALVGRLGRFGALPLRRARQFSRLRYTLVSLTQVVIYQGANVRFLSFPPPREGGDD
ncbi:MAG TPA: hypothetical protein IGS52_22890 [Oscillatoriaceae cyanobacterium M33_DOE_052]|nr:hypothetical protein [Oscillatoriaceae cyanobacterium M33_DOE_052]